MLPDYAPVLKPKVKFSRTFLIIWILLMSSAGAKALIFSQASTTKGEIRLTSYVTTANGLQPIGNVAVTVESVGGAQKCASNSGVTNASGRDSVTLTGCDVSADGTAKMYRLVSATRPGYAFKSLHSNHGPGRPIEANNSFKVVRGDVTSLQVWMEDLTPPAATPSAPPPAPASTSNTKASLRIITYEYENGDLTKPVRRGNIKVSLSSPPAPNGATFSCERMTADSAKEPEVPKSDEDRYAVVKLDECQVSESTGTKLYQVSGSHPEYDLASVREVKAGESWPVLAEGKIELSKNTPKTVAVFMKPKAGTATTQQAPGPTTPAPASEKNGSIRVITYDYNGGNKVRQGNAVIHVKAAGDQYRTNDVSRNCDDYNKTTDTNGGPSNPNYGRAHFSKCWTSSDGSKTYEISFISIPAGFTLRSFHITNGKFHGSSLESVRNTQGVQFTVKANQETQLEIWFDKAAPVSTPAAPTQNQDGSPAPSGAPAERPAAVRQVVTQDQVSFVAAGNQREISKELAEALNQIPVEIRNEGAGQTVADLIAVAIDSGYTNPNFEPYVAQGDGGSGAPSASASALSCDTSDDEQIPCPALPPSAPTTPVFTQDEAGLITLKWSASTVNEKAGPISYIVKRIHNNTRVNICEDITLDTEKPNPTEDLTCDDDASATDENNAPIKLDYPATYTYEVYAVTGDDDEREIGLSAPLVAQFTTLPIKPNIDDADSPDGTADSANPAGDSVTLSTSSATPDGTDGTADDPGEEPVEDEVPVEDEEVDIEAEIDIPLDANEDAMACAISEGDYQSDMTEGLGEAVGEESVGLTCRTEDGDIVDEFDEDVEYSLEIDDEDLEGDEDLYAYDGVGWEKVEDDETVERKGSKVKYANAQKVKGDNKTRFSLKSKLPLRLAVLSQDRSVPPFVWVAVSLAVTASVGAYVVSRRQHKLKYSYMNDADIVPLTGRHSGDGK